MATFLREKAARAPSRSEMHDRVEGVLTGTTLWTEYKDRLSGPARNLSGGQQQRPSLAPSRWCRKSFLWTNQPFAASGMEQTSHPPAYIYGSGPVGLSVGTSGPHANLKGLVILASMLVLAPTVNATSARSRPAIHLLERPVFVLQLPAFPVLPRASLRELAARPHPLLLRGGARRA
jgi:hypothetical protein